MFIGGGFLGNCLLSQSSAKNKGFGDGSTSQPVSEPFTGTSKPSLGVNIVAVWTIIYVPKVIDPIKKFLKKHYPIKSRKLTPIKDMPPIKTGASPSTPKLPEFLSNSQIEDVMSKINTLPCLAFGSGKVRVTITVNDTGLVKSAISELSSLSSCLEEIVRELKFPLISRPSQTFLYVINVE
jgi:hypothetical protein